MYNRYIPTGDGGFQRQSVSQSDTREPPASPPPATMPKEHTPPAKRLPALDKGDLLVLLILLLLLDSGEEDSMTLLLAAGIYLFSK